MQRIAIIGNAGGGKSTLARRLSVNLGIPWHPVDRWQWLPGWEPAAPHAFDEAHEQALAEPRWIIDGWGPPAALERRLRAADTIIWVDLPLRVHLRRAARRQVGSLLGRDDAPPGCSRWRVTGRMFRLILRVERERESLHELLERAAREGGGTLVHLTTVRDLAGYGRD